ncbi:MAG: WD40 repeat domain-containing protein [Gemmataceae bacterium]
MHQWKVPRTKRIVALSWHPTRRVIAALTSAAEDQVEALVWLDATTGAVLQTLPLDVERCALRSDHGCFVVGHAAETRRRGVSPVQWGAVPEPGAKVAWTNVEEVPHRHIFGLAFTTGGQGIAIGCAGQRRGNREWVHAIYLASLTGGPSVHFPVEGMPGEIALSHDEAWMAVSGGIGAEPEVRFHRFPSPEITASYRPQATRTQRLAFHPSSPLLAALCGKQVVLLPAGQKEPLAILEAHTARVNDVVFTPNGQRCLTASHDGTIQVWESHSGRRITGYTWSVGKLTALAVSPDGCTAATAGEKGALVIWDLDE